MAILRYARLWGAFIKNCFMREIEYRGHLFMQFLVDVAWYGVQIALFHVIYLNTNSMAGLSRGEMAVFLGTVFVIDGINMAFFSHNFWHFPSMILKGDLDFYLTKPISTFFMTFTRYANIASWGNFAIAAAVLWFGITTANIPLTFGKVSLFLLLIICGNLVMLAMQAIVSGIAIFLVRAEGIQGIFHNLYQFATRPDGIFPTALRRVLLYILPMSLIASVPASSLLGTITPALALWNIFGSLILIWSGVQFFNWTLKFYTGASA